MRATSSERRLLARAKRFCRGTRTSVEGVRKLLERARECGYCGKPIDALAGRKSPRALEVDHMLPKGRGGTNALRNLHATCRRCNRAKGSLTHVEFVYLLDKLGQFPEMKERVLRRLAASRAWY